MNEPGAAASAAAHQAVKTLLLAALDLPPTERAAWLAALEHRDPARAPIVRRLLDAHERAGAFLDLPDEPGDAGAGAMGAGGTIGPFTIERELGRGGMGTVFLGTRRDPGFEQQAAIKVLAGDAGAAAAERLRDERRILAGLNHPGIAHFIDGGTTADGRPYIAMEYVDGLPITAWCEAQHLDTPARLRLFITICGAVHFAHQRLVVHRDVKPSNIMVTAQGQPKLLDFGIAKLLAPGGTAGATATVPLLTPHYASPEQATGDTVTTATDVYSLGVLLYELLTGTGPYPGVTRDATPLVVLDAVRGTPPERPSAAAARVRHVMLDRDLDAVLLKALRKDPAARYGSCEQFADDIGRVLDGRPVLARQGSRSYAARKFVARHRAGVGAAVVATLSLTGATAVSIRQTRVAEAQRARAESRFDDVRQLAHSFVFEFDEAVRDIPGTTTARKLVIARSLVYLEQLARDARDDVALQRELAAAYQRVGDVQGNPYLPNLGERAASLASYTKALGLRQMLASAPGATDADQAALGSALQATGDLLWAAGDFAGALTHHTQARVLNTKRMTLAPGDAAVAYDAARSSYRVGQDLVKLGRFAEARQEYAWAADASLQSAVPEHGRFNAVATLKVGDALLRAGAVTDAVGAYRQSHDALTRLRDRDPGSAILQRSLAFVVHRLAVAEAVQGHLDAAAALAVEALTAQQRLQAADPSDRQTQGDIALSLCTLSGIDVLRGRLADAGTHVARALVIYDALTAAGAGFIDLRSEQAVALRRLGDVADARGRASDALAHYRDAAALLEQAPIDGEYVPELAVVGLRGDDVARRTGADRAGWQARARTAWARASAAGVRAWMMEFGSPTRLLDAAAALDAPVATRR